MQKMCIRFTAGGREAIADIGLAEWCGWEEETGRTMPSITGDNMGIRDLAALIYAWLKWRGEVTVPFKAWLPTLEDLEVVEAMPDPKPIPPEASDAP